MKYRAINLMPCGQKRFGPLCSNGAMSCVAATALNFYSKLGTMLSANSLLLAEVQAWLYAHIWALTRNMMLGNAGGLGWG